MATVEKGFARGKEVYVGIDVHKKDWTVHVVCLDLNSEEGTCYRRRVDFQYRRPHHDVRTSA